LKIGMSQNTQGQGAARRLHRREAIERQHRGHIQGQRLDVVNGQRRAIGIGKLVQIANDGTGDVSNDFLAFAPNDARDSARILDIGQVVGQKFFTFADAHRVHLGAIPQEPFLIHGGEHPPDDNGHVRKLFLNRARHAFGARIGSGGQE